MIFKVPYNSKRSVTPLQLCTQHISGYWNMGLHTAKDLGLWGPSENLTWFYKVLDLVHFTATNLSNRTHPLNWLVQTMSTCESQIKPGFHYGKQSDQKTPKGNNPFRHEAGMPISPSSVVLLNGYEISLLITWFTVEKNSKICKGYRELCYVENPPISYLLISSSHFSPSSKVLIVLLSSTFYPNVKFLVFFAIKYILWSEWFGNSKWEI